MAITKVTRNLLSTGIVDNSNATAITIDSSERVLVGFTTSDWPNPSFQIEGIGASTSGLNLFRNSNDASGPYLNMGSSRGTSVNSDTIVQNGDALGTIYFYGAGGSDREQSGGYIQCAIDGTPGNNDMPGRLVFATTADGGVGGTERMRITAGGLIGIGTTNPIAQLGVGGAGRRIEIDGTSGVIRGYDRTASWAALDFEASAYTFDCSTARMLDVAASGVIINEDSADADFRVESNGNANMFWVDGGNNDVLIGNTTVTPASGHANQAGFGYQSEGVVEIANTNNATTLVIGKNQGTDGNFIDFRKESNPVGTISVLGANNLTISGTVASHAGISFATNSIIPATAGAINDATTDLGQNGNRFKDIWLSGGVNFSGNANAAGMTSETLDDYEEGTWTGVITTTGTDFTTSSRGSDCKYTKIGDTVVAWFSVSIASPTGGSGDLKLTGLPFTSLSGNTTYRTGQIDWGRTDNVATLQVNGTLAGDATEITFTSLRDANTSLAFPASNMNGQVTPFFTGRVTYKTA